MNKEKIQKVIKKMLKDNKDIKSVVKVDGVEVSITEEYYFTYPVDKYLWSLGKDYSGGIYIYYYPSRETRSEFLRFGPEELDYSAQEDLRSLMEVVRGKLYDFDEVIDDILGV